MFMLAVDIFITSFKEITLFIFYEFRIIHVKLEVLADCSESIHCISI